MRHDDDRLPEAFAAALEFVVHFAARERIERAEWLVHQQNRRIGGQRARHAYSLALPSGKLVRIALQELLRVEPHKREQFAARAA